MLKGKRLLSEGRRSEGLKVWIASSVAVLFFAVQSAPAIDFIRQNQFTLEAEDALQNEIWISAQTINLRGEALDDLLGRIFSSFCIGK